MSTISLKPKIQFTLTFDESNNFDSTNNVSTRIDIAKNVLWVINNAMLAIQISYKDGAPRRIEMENIWYTLKNQLRDQLTEEEITELKLTK